MLNGHKNKQNALKKKKQRDMSFNRLRWRILHSHHFGFMDFIILAYEQREDGNRNQKFIRKQ